MDEYFPNPGVLSAASTLLPAPHLPTPCRWSQGVWGDLSTSQNPGSHDCLARRLKEEWSCDILEQEEAWRGQGKVAGLAILVG